MHLEAAGDPAKAIPDFRLAALKKLQAAVQANERALAEAMAADFRKAQMEVYMTETGMVLDEIRFHLKHLRAWMRETRVPTPLGAVPSRSFRWPPEAVWRPA